MQVATDCLISHMDATEQRSAQLSVKGQALSAGDFASHMCSPLHYPTMPKPSMPDRNKLMSEAVYK